MGHRKGYPPRKKVQKTLFLLEHNTVDLLAREILVIYNSKKPYQSPRHQKNSFFSAIKKIWDDKKYEQNLNHVHEWHRYPVFEKIMIKACHNIQPIQKEVIVNKNQTNLFLMELEPMPIADRIFFTVAMLPIEAVEKFEKNLGGPVYQYMQKWLTDSSSDQDIVDVFFACSQEIENLLGYAQVKDSEERQYFFDTHRPAEYFELQQ